MGTVTSLDKSPIIAKALRLHELQKSFLEGRLQIPPISSIMIEQYKRHSRFHIASPQKEVPSESG